MTIKRPFGKYQILHDVLMRALAQASSGKGHERHGQDLDFEVQPMQMISELLGTGAGLAFQAVKKIQEAQRLPTTEAKVFELLGAINYLAGEVIYLERQEGRKAERMGALPATE